MAKILIVDDAAFMRATLKQILTEAGHEVVGEAKNGAEAIRLYPMLEPDLTTMDITMPEVDGIASLREIRRLDPKAKVIVCSAMGNKKMVVAAIESGAQDFIVKPFQAERVMAAIDRHVKRADT